MTIEEQVASCDRLKAEELATLEQSIFENPVLGNEPVYCIDLFNRVKGYQLHRAGE